jgi:sigma-E factor negative regulatory protein RseC
LGTIQHRGIVENIDRNIVTVGVVSQSACAGCHAKGLCTERGEKRIITVDTPYASTFEVGERVVVAIENSMALTSVLWCYVIPLVILLCVLFGTNSYGVQDSIAAISSLSAVAIYYVGLYVMRKQFDKKIKFTIIKE